MSFLSYHGDVLQRVKRKLIQNRSIVHYVHCCQGLVTTPKKVYGNGFVVTGTLCRWCCSSRYMRRCAELPVMSVLCMPVTSSVPGKQDDSWGVYGVNQPGSLSSSSHICDFCQKKRLIFFNFQNNFLFLFVIKYMFGANLVKIRLII